MSRAAGLAEKRPDEVKNGFDGLVEEVRGRTNPVNEALSIAYHNAVIVIDAAVLSEARVENTEIGAVCGTGLRLARALKWALFAVVPTQCL